MEPRPVHQLAGAEREGAAVSGCTGRSHASTIAPLALPCYRASLCRPWVVSGGDRLGSRHVHAPLPWICHASFACPVLVLTGCLLLWHVRCRGLFDVVACRKKNNRESAVLPSTLKRCLPLLHRGTTNGLPMTLRIADSVVYRPTQKGSKPC